MQSREVERSGVYYLGGEILTYEQMVEINDPSDEVLRSNMRANDFPLVIINRNSWKSANPFNEEDVLLDHGGNEVQRGDEPTFVAYRAMRIAKWRGEAESEGR